jgi:ribosomal-protein-alanine N-acetyltransferase
MYLFQSERLGFRQWQTSDLPTFIEMNADAEVMRFFPAPLGAEESIALAERIIKGIEEYGYGFFAVDRREEGDFIGFIGLINTTFESHFTPCVEIGWRLRKEFWNKGYATEGAKRCLQYGFETLKLDEIYSFTPSPNLPSARVMQKIGMQQVGTFEHPRITDGHPLKIHVLYHTSRKYYI